VLARAIRRWTEMAHESARMQAAASRAVRCWTKQLLARAMRKWCAALLYSVRLIELGARVLSLWQKRVVGAVWRRWAQVSAQGLQLVSIARRVVVRWERAGLASALSRWMEHRDQLRLMRRALARAVGLWKSRAAASALRSWRLHFRRAVRCKETLLFVLGRHATLPLNVRPRLRAPPRGEWPQVSDALPWPASISVHCMPPRPELHTARRQAAAAWAQRCDRAMALRCGV
jgi:hypothetical protein